MSAIIIRLYCMKTSAVNGYVGIEYTVLDIELPSVCVDSIEYETQNGGAKYMFGQRVCFIKLNLSTYTRKIRDKLENCVQLKQSNTVAADAAAFFFSRSQWRWIAAMRQIHANKEQPKKWWWTNELSRVHLMKAKVMLKSVCIVNLFIQLTLKNRQRPYIYTYKCTVLHHWRRTVYSM